MDWEPSIIKQEDVERIKTELLEHSEAPNLVLKLKSLMKGHSICMATFKQLKLVWHDDLRKISKEQQTLAEAEDLLLESK